MVDVAHKDTRERTNNNDKRDEQKGTTGPNKRDKQDERKGHLGDSWTW